MDLAQRPKPPAAATAIAGRAGFLVLAGTLDEQVCLRLLHGFRKITVWQNRNDRAEFLLRKQIRRSGAVGRHQDQTDAFRYVESSHSADFLR